MSKLMHEKNITLHKLIDETNSLTLDNLYGHLSRNSSFEDLSKNDEKEYIVGTIKKSYAYDAKRVIGKENVSGRPEFKFFKFLIKKTIVTLYDSVPLRRNVWWVWCVKRFFN